MAQMVIKGQFQTGQLALDVGISDLMVTVVDGKSVLYTNSGQNGGLAAFELNPNGSVSILDTALFNSAWAEGALRDMYLMEVNGAICIAVAGNGEDQLHLFDINANGSLGQAVTMTGISTEMSQVQGLSQTEAQTLFMADANTGMISGYEINANGTLSQTMQVADTSTTYSSGIMAVDSTKVLNKEYVISVSETEKGVSVYRVDGNSLQNTGNAGVNEGIGVMTPTDMKVVEMGGRSFVLLASAPGDGQGQSGAITVMELAQDGSLVSTDHIIDTRETHFGNVQSLEVVEADGRTYVVAGGGDDGVTLFVLMPNGRLQLLGTVSDDPGLQNISSVAAHFDGGTLSLFVSSEMEGGVTEITVDLTNHGEIIEGSHAGGTITGGAKDDILIGGVGNDNIIGGAGDDLLEDGLGVDTIHGGDGSDTFILRSDFSHDEIRDFEAGVDQLDLSAWPMLYDPAQIGYTATANGAILSWRGETLELFSRDGQTLSFSEIQAAILKTANRVPDFSSFGGNGGNDNIDGTAINDAYNTGSGNDTVDAFAGNDYIDAGEGNDRVTGGLGQDTIILGNGWDYAHGGDQEDLIYGGGGRDEIWGGNQADTIYGGPGVDTIRGQQGEDLIFGGNERDIILGDNSNDTLYGEGGNDVVRGGNGNDLVYGNEGNDRLFGANHEDTIYGGDGNDLIRAGFQADFADGGAGNDYIVGGGGFDTLVGGTGNDTMEGNFNADRFWFEDGHGNDVIVDFEATNNAEKLVFSELSTMNSYSEVMQAAVQQGADVFIDTGLGNSILLENVLLTDLDPNDFIF
ncbi:calcium-binding protein [Gymnodinialimonas sp.]